MFAELSKALGPDGARYRDAALRAADYVWQAQGTKGVFTGATLDNPNVIDKEAGMLSLEAFLSAYDLTQDPKWISRAAAAADFTESWMYIWDVPMAVDAIEGELHWKKGVPTTGRQRDQHRRAWRCGPSIWTGRLPPMRACIN